MLATFTRRTIGAAALAVPVLALLAAGAQVQPPTPDDIAARLGTPLDTSTRSVAAAPRIEYSQAPLTVELWARLTQKAGYNILVANEDKPSVTHWELFTWPGTGALTAYVPGRSPDHVRSEAPIADGRWHAIAMVMEERRIRLFVDGKPVADQAEQPPSGPGTRGPLAIGSLVNGEINCSGQIADVRLTRWAREITGLPTGPYTADAGTIGLWRFDKGVGTSVADLSPLGNALVAKETAERAFWPSYIAGGMSAAFLPMPAGPDPAPLRSSLRAGIARAGLTGLRDAEFRDAVLRDWDVQFTSWGKREYPIPGGADPAMVEKQVYDRHALVWKADGGPLGTVLRRTGALAARLRSTAPGLLADLARLRAVAGKEKPSADSPGYRDLYLAACAVRRKIALGDPLLNFDRILFAARGSFEGSARSNPSTGDHQGGHFITQYFGFNTIPGGGLYMVRNFKGTPSIIDLTANAVVTNGRLKGQKLTTGAFISPALSYDGKTVYFAYTENREHKWVYSRRTVWHIFRIGVDGSNLVQLTDGDSDDFDPCPLPDGRIAFVSERRGGYIRCFARLHVRNYALFSMARDGSDIRPMSYFETAEWNPSVTNDGRLAYTRWDYVDRENCLGTRLWLSGTDGSDPRSPHGNYPEPYTTLDGNKPWTAPSGRQQSDSRWGTPIVEMGIRAIPGSNRLICTASPHHGQFFGSLAMLDLSVPDDNYMSQVKRITPDEPFPETETPGRMHYKYGTPWPLGEDFYLCNIWENLYLLDRYGNRELLCEMDLLPCKHDERLRLIFPSPVRPRPMPPASPARKGPTGAPATMAVMNVYDSDLPFPKDAKAKWLRVTQTCLKSNPEIGAPMIGYERENVPRIPLGVVPVEADGSVYFQAPVGKELIFQVLDENHMAIQSMRSAAFVHPGEQLRCQGCHEQVQRPPYPKQPPAALRKPPAKLVPELGVVEPISYYRQVKPIVTDRCLPCHTRLGKGPQEMSHEALRDLTFWFSGAMLNGMNTEYSGTHGGSRTIPGRFGARYCRLGKALLDPTHAKAVSEMDRRTIALWIDSNSPRLGAYRDEALQMKGELVWPELDVDPANPAGLEGAGPAMRRNFWHENNQGPYACLISEHEHDRIAILDTTGKIVWEYSLPHPQDVWMLPNGNILTTYYQGVREISRDKKVVWEYRTEKPNEIPNCQPLPGGNVLIGIVGECRLIEVDRSGKIVHEVKLQTTEKTPHAQFRMCRKTPQGTYLVPFTAEGAIREYDASGKVVAEFPGMGSPVCALRLPTGNTLISGGGAVTEFDTLGAVVWRVNGEWLPDVNIATPAGIQRLPNGNTIICNWNTRDADGRDGAHIMEVTLDKRIVWQVTGTQVGQVAQCQILTPDLMPRKEAIIR